MAKFSGQRDDPFICSSEREHDGYLISAAMLKRYKTAKDLLSAHNLTDLCGLADIATSSGRWEDQKNARRQTARAITNTRGQALRRAIWVRFSAASMAGMFLLVPMWVLTLRAENVYLQLGVASGCVTAFGLLMAWMLPTVDAVFASTLAYAAVLMVFVGVVMQELQT